MGTIIIVSIIVIYAAFVIRGKVKDVKSGKICSCNCSNCHMSTKCHNIKNMK